jgi:hypothetical protein
MCRYSFSSFAFNRRHCVDASIFSKEFRLNKRFISRHCDIHHIFYALSNFDRVLFDMLTTIKRRRRDRILLKVNKLFNINLFSRFALSFDFQIHFECYVIVCKKRLLSTKETHLVLCRSRASWRQVRHALDACYSHRMTHRARW